MVSHLVYILGNVTTFVATNFYSLMVCRFLVGAAHMTVSHLPYMLGNLFKTLINHSLDVSERPENKNKKIVLYTYIRKLALCSTNRILLHTSSSDS